MAADTDSHLVSLTVVDLSLASAAGAAVAVALLDAVLQQGSVAALSATVAGACSAGLLLRLNLRISQVLKRQRKRKVREPS